MKKIAIFLILLVFAAFAYLGFQAASTLRANSAIDGMPANAATALASTQQNVLLVHVDDLSAAKPKLISVWGVFVYYANNNQVMFIPLLPSYDSAVQNQMLTDFSLDKSRHISTRFISRLQQKFNIKVTGVVMVDNAGLSILSTQFTGQTNPVVAAVPEGKDQIHLVLMNGQFFFQSICATVQSKNKDIYTALDWGQLAPDHLVTTIPFETIMVDFQKVFGSSASNQCSVLSNE